ncbi:hypothetical protein FDENT_11705 [Fusarium denticulatum]|uniref:Uncharacterized protein n=1 Tax=Fusarium denticulatum TaxID=48507 RepID=A0A8H5WQS5_9HYPO|nr:hypothetical protein FDENT_11705 [Fusarium denticulatum]
MDAAVSVTESGDVEGFQKYLFLLTQATAHELVHMIMGYLFGSSDTLTPPLLNYPTGGANSPQGESDRYWEQKMFGCFVKAYYDPRNVAMYQSQARQFRDSSNLRCKGNEDIRQASHQPDFRGDLTAYFLAINSLPTIRVSRDSLAQITQMAFDPYLVRPPRMTSSSRSRREEALDSHVTAPRGVPLEPLVVDDREIIGNHLSRQDNMLPPSEVEMEDGVVGVGPFFELQPRVVPGNLKEVPNQRFTLVSWLVRRVQFK